MTQKRVIILFLIFFILYNLEKDAQVSKKKKKKEPPFVVPEWAKELDVLIEKTTTMKKYVKIYKEIGLDDAFAIKTKEELKRFDKEIPFRKEEEETKRKLEEEKAAKKNKKKK